MTSPQAWHCWAVITDSLPLAPAPHVEVTCHRRLRGPYTGAGALLRQIVPELLAHNADLVLPRATDIVAIAPELAAVLPLPGKTLTGRTERLVHCVAELLMDWAGVRHPDGAVVAFTDVAEADATDRELLRVLLRRCDPRRLTIVVEAADPGADPALGDALVAYARCGARRARRPAPGDGPAQPHVDSLVDRVDLLLSNEDLVRAAADVAHGLALYPHNARLLSARGADRIAERAA